jgi:hypothetical protein
MESNSGKGAYRSNGFVINMYIYVPQEGKNSFSEVVKDEQYVSRTNLMNSDDQ